MPPPPHKSVYPQKMSVIKEKKKACAREPSMAAIVQHQLFWWQNKHV